MNTIRRRLLAGLVCAIALCGAGAGTVLYRSLLEELNELADLQLRQLAVRLPDDAVPAAAYLPGDPEEEFALQSWNGAGALVHATALPGYPQLPRQRLDGLATLRFGGVEWRVYGTCRHGHCVQVAQPMAVRNRLARALSWRVGAPLLAFAALLLMLAMLVVHKALQPLRRLAAGVADRSPSTLAPLAPDGWPAELAPIVLALNALLARCAQALAAQRTFVADAAHELRTPLTAIKLQLQLAERETDADARGAALTRLHARLDRASHLVHQLLSLATHESGHAALQMTPVDVQSLFEDVVTDHAPLADRRAIDLGVEQPTTLALHAHREGLQCLLNNLVDNALRYTQRGGRVDLGAALEHGRVVLTVADDGPGIPLQHQARVFDRFFRPEGQEATGCGLGLSIVRNIADHHSARVELGAGAGDRGLAVRIVFPANATVAAAPQARNCRAASGAARGVRPA